MTSAQCKQLSSWALLKRGKTIDNKKINKDVWIWSNKNIPMIYCAAAFYCGAMCRVLDWSTKQLVANAWKIFASEYYKRFWLYLISSGVYKDCEIEFSLKLQNYPSEPPVVTSESKFLHPNIDQDRDQDVCLNLLAEWDTYDGRLSLALSLV